jgi:hypothetical protein
VEEETGMNKPTVETSRGGKDCTTEGVHNRNSLSVEDWRQRDGVS